MGYIQEKRMKAQTQKLMEQQQRQNSITKAIEVQQAQQEPKEIKLHSMNSSTSKKTKEVDIISSLWAEGGVNPIIL